MRKEFHATTELFSTFSAELIAGDTAILNEIGIQNDWLYRIAELLRRGVVVRTPNQTLLDSELRSNADIVESLARLTVAMDRKTRIQTTASVASRQLTKDQKCGKLAQKKAHQLITQNGMSLVEACRKAHCRPSDYYIYRSKLKNRN